MCSELENGPWLSTGFCESWRSFYVPLTPTPPSSFWDYSAPQLQLVMCHLAREAISQPPLQLGMACGFWPLGCKCIGCVWSRLTFLEWKLVPRPFFPRAGSWTGAVQVRGTLYGMAEAVRQEEAREKVTVQGRATTCPGWVSKLEKQTPTWFEPGSVVSLLGQFIPV